MYVQLYRLDDSFFFPAALPLRGMHVARSRYVVEWEVGERESVVGPLSSLFSSSSAPMS